MESGLVKFKDNIYFTSESIEKLKVLANEIVSEESVKKIAEHFSIYNTNKSNKMKKQ